MDFEALVDVLENCKDHLADDLEGEEYTSRERVVALCKDIVFDWDNHVRHEVEG